MTYVTKFTLLVAWFYIQSNTDGTLIRAEEGPKVLHAPPTAHIVQSIPILAVAVDTLGEYIWRHSGDFSISTLNPFKPPKKPKKLNNFFSQILT